MLPRVAVCGQLREFLIFVLFILRRRSAGSGSAYKLPFHGLKIDRSFIQTLPEEAGGRNRTIVEAILALSGKTDLEVTAEGVETLAQFDYLHARGCELVQGFYFGKPKPAEELPLS